MARFRFSTVSLASLLVLSIAPITAHAGGPEDPSPDLAVEETTWEAPPVIPGETLEHVFRFRNEGTAPLIVERLATFNPYLEARVEPEVVPPGEEGRIHATLRTGTISGTGVLRITLETNDPEAERTDFVVRYDVRPAVLAHPGNARWIMVRGEEPGTISQVVGAPGEDPVRVTGVDVDHPGIETAVRPASEEERREDLGQGPQWVVDLTLRSDASVGAIEGFARIRTDHPVQKTVVVPISGFVRPQLHVEPAIADLGVAPRVRKSKWTLQLRNFGTKPIEVKSVSTDLPTAEVSVAPVEGKEGHLFRLELVIDPEPMEPGRFQGKLVVKTTSEVDPRLEVPFSGTIAGETVDEPSSP